MLSDIDVAFDGPDWSRPMTASGEAVKIVTVASCSNLRDEHRGHVAVSGSYGGRYNAYNAAKWPVRAVIMNDAGIGKDDAGIVGLEFLDRINMAAATQTRRPAISAMATICSPMASSATSTRPPRPWAARSGKACAPAPS